MSQRILKFPSNFLWGVATASHQNEGDNRNNDFWNWEQIPGHVVDGTTSSLACNWWQNPLPDFDLIQNLGLNTLRLSLEWSRIEPKENVWDKDVFAKYRQWLIELKQRNITPMITLHHFTNPMWLAEQGGWENTKVVNFFGRYTQKVVEELGELCQIWCTINEPIIYGTHAYLIGRWYPGKKSLLKLVKVTRNQVHAHNLAYNILHAKNPNYSIGMAQHCAAFAAANSSRASKSIATIRDNLLNWRFLDAIALGKWRFPCSLWPKTRKISCDTNDYFGINYYGRHLVKFSLKAVGELFGEAVPAHPDIAWMAPWQDREIYPAGIGEFLEKMYQRYHKPLYITENGIADNEDSIRSRFLLTHLASVHRAIQKGIPVKGFYHWTLVDNYEWVEGWTTRFGLVKLNPTTQERTLRPSGTLFSEIAKQNAITEETVLQYCPAVAKEIF